MAEFESPETRERVDRWMQEGQYLLGRIIPGLLEQQDRLKGRANAAEETCERLRQDVTDLQNQVASLRNENDLFRKEQTEIREVFGRLRDQLNQLVQPVNDILQRLQVPTP